MPKAVAVDLGAGSGRIALGELVDGRIESQIFKQIAHEPRSESGHLLWNFDLLVGLCREAVSLGETEKAASFAIDSWGVDLGFLDRDGKLMGAPVCYRDLSHLAAFETLAPHRRRLFELTGIQHQVFNTICQLIARKHEDPTFPDRVSDWMILPDLLGTMIGGKPNSELTQGSTTQLMGTDCKWSREAFEITGWPVPEREVSAPGRHLGQVGQGVELVSVGSHDTASAVAGFGTLYPDELFLNVGTWSLVGSVIDECLTSVEAEQGGFSNERTVDGRVRFLKNIPGFYFLNRLHADLAIDRTVPEWLQSAVVVDEAIDLFHPDFFNPESMLVACQNRLSRRPASPEEWAGVALRSLVGAVSQTSVEVAKLTGQSYSRVRVGGGGSQSREFCQGLANRMGLPVLAGPTEATVLGNLAAQFVAQGAIKDWGEAGEVVKRSIVQVAYSPA